MDMSVGTMAAAPSRRLRRGAAKGVRATTHPKHAERDLDADHSITGPKRMLT